MVVFMRIAFLSTSMGMGGADKQILQISEELQKRGHEIVIISLTELGNMGYMAIEKGIEVKCFNNNGKKTNFISFIKIFRYLKKWNPDLLTTFMYHANVSGKVIGKLIGVPVITSIRNEKFGGKLREKIEAGTNFLAKTSTTNSRIAAKSLVKRGIVSSEKMHLIHNGIQIEEYQLDFSTDKSIQKRNNLNIGENTFLWLAVGRLREQKDYPNLIRALSLIENSDFRLIIAGKGLLQEKLQNLVASLGLADKVKFLGARNDIAELLQIADGFVLSSAWEGLPNVLMEAAAAAKPIVATNVGGVSELLPVEQHRFLLPANDSDSLAEKMQELMGMPEELLKKIGKSNYQFLAENFALGKIVDDWEALFRNTFTS